MFARPLLHEFREPKKTTKLKGANIDTIPTLISIDVENLRLAHHQTTECSVFRFVFQHLPEPNRACLVLVGVYAVMIDPYFPYME